MFENAKVGDRVWDFVRNEWGEIIKIDKRSEYPLNVKFKRDGYRYTVDGKIYKDDGNPRLFWQEIKFEIPEKPFKLVNLLNDYILDDRLIPKVFTLDEDNAYFCYDVYNRKMCWDTHCRVFFPGMQLFELNEDLLDEIVNKANNGNVTFEEFQTAFKELGWL